MLIAIVIKLNKSKLNARVLMEIEIEYEHNKNVKKIVKITTTKDYLLILCTYTETTTR